MCYQHSAIVHILKRKNAYLYGTLTFLFLPRWIQFGLSSRSLNNIMSEAKKQPKNLLHATKEERKAFLDSFDYLLADCDGKYIVYNTSDVIAFDSLVVLCRHSLGPNRSIRGSQRGY